MASLLRFSRAKILSFSCSISYYNISFGPIISNMRVCDYGVLAGGNPLVIVDPTPAPPSMKGCDLGLEICMAFLASSDMV